MRRVGARFWEVLPIFAVGLGVLFTAGCPERPCTYQGLDGEIRIYSCSFGAGWVPGLEVELAVLELEDTPETFVVEPLDTNIAVATIVDVDEDQFLIEAVGLGETEIMITGSTGRVDRFSIRVVDPAALEFIDAAAIHAQMIPPEELYGELVVPALTSPARVVASDAPFRISWYSIDDQGRDTVATPLLLNMNLTGGLAWDENGILLASGQPGDLGELTADWNGQPLNSLEIEMVDDRQATSLAIGAWVPVQGWDSVDPEEKTTFLGYVRALAYDEQGEILWGQPVDWVWTGPGFLLGNDPAQYSNSTSLMCTPVDPSVACVELDLRRPIDPAKARMCVVANVEGPDGLISRSMVIENGQAEVIDGQCSGCACSAGWRVGVEGRNGVAVLILLAPLLGIAVRRRDKTNSPP